MSTRQASVVSPASLKNVVGSMEPRFGNAQQQDASELLLSLTDLTGRELGERSPFEVNMKGYVTQVTKCKVCLETVEKTQKFHQLQLPVLKQTCTLKECWDTNFADDVLDDAECYFCGVVGQRVQKYTIEVGRILVVHLKRFCFDGDQTTKIDTLVEAPQDWVPVENGFTYKLVATVNHHGENLEKKLQLRVKYIPLEIDEQNETVDPPNLFYIS